MEEINSDETKDNALEQLNTFCGQVSQIMEDVLKTFRAKVTNHIEIASENALKLATDLQKVNVGLKACQEGSEIYIPLSKLVNVHNDVVALDQKIASLKEDLIAPCIDTSNKNEFSFIESSFKSVLVHFSGKSLLDSIFLKYWEEENCSGEDKDVYVPNLLQTLHNAVTLDDLKGFQNILEKSNFHADAMKYIVDYKFQPFEDLEESMDVDDNSEDEQEDKEDEESEKGDEDVELKRRSYTLLMLAAICGSVKTAKYLIHLDTVNLMETFDGKSLVHHLLTTGNITAELENLI